MEILDGLHISISTMRRSFRNLSLLCWRIDGINMPYVDGLGYEPIFNFKDFKQDVKEWTKSSLRNAKENRKLLMP